MTNQGRVKNEMEKSGFAFHFEIPDGWTEFPIGNRFVFQGPKGEELIVSGTIINGEGSDSERDATRKRLLQGALESVKQAASQPELVVIKPLECDGRVGNLERWRLGSQTVDKNTLFFESVYLADRALLLVTFEAPNNAASERLYEQFIESVRSMQS